MIPISKPFTDENEIIATTKVLQSGWLMQGPKVAEFENDFAAYLNNQYAIATSSGTSALHLALVTVGVKPGDFVITVSHSFIATASSIRNCQAEPLFIDIEPDGLNIDVAQLKNILSEDCSKETDGIYFKKMDKFEVHPQSPLRYCKPTKKIAAILVVHQLGIPCDMERILKISSEWKIPVVEDAACAIGSEILINNELYKIGAKYNSISVFSFHPRKIITTGDGGMIVTSNQKWAEKIKLLRNHGQMLSEDKKHLSYDVSAFNYRLTDLQAAVGIAQLKKLDQFIEERRTIFNKYLKKFENLNYLKILNRTGYEQWNIQSFVLELDQMVNQKHLMDYLLANEISSRQVCMNAHEEKSYSPYQIYSLINSEQSTKQRILLPLFNGMNDKEIDYICEQLKKYEAKYC